MSTLELENIADATTGHWTPGTSQSDQRNPVTRRIGFDAYSAELETRAIERNREFHSTILQRLATPAPQLIDANEVLAGREAAEQSDIAIESGRPRGRGISGLRA